MTADGVIFTGASNYPFVGLGKLGDPLDLAFPFHLGSAVVTLRDGSGAIQAQGDFIPFVVNPNPWDGIFTGLGISGGFVGFASTDTRSIELAFAPAAVPEPSTLTLLLAGAVVAYLGFHRRERRSLAAQRVRRS